MINEEFQPKILKGEQNDVRLSGRQDSGVLLDMLAEVASKTLLHADLTERGNEKKPRTKPARNIAPKTTKTSSSSQQQTDLANAVLFDHCYSHVTPVEHLVSDTQEIQYHVVVPDLDSFDQHVQEDSTESMEPEPEVVEKEINLQEGHTLRQLLSESKASKNRGRNVKKVGEGPEMIAQKPRGKAKFIGQSMVEKTLALFKIEQIKSKQLSPLDSLECHICSPPRTFTAPTTLLSHYRSHAGIRPFECKICQAAFTRQHSLNYHLLIHSNETRFTCRECGRKFRHPSHFREHQRRHTGEAPYECLCCNTRFKTRNTYKRHLKTRHNQEMWEVSSCSSTSPQQPDVPDSPEPPAVVSRESPNKVTPRRGKKRAINEVKRDNNEDIVELAIRNSNLHLEHKTCDEERTPMSLNEFTEIALSITERERSPVVDTVLTFQYSTALSESEPVISACAMLQQPYTTNFFMPQCQ